MRLALLSCGLAMTLPFFPFLTIPAPVHRPPRDADHAIPPVRLAWAEAHGRAPDVLPVRMRLAEEKAVARKDELDGKVRNAIDYAVSFLSEQRKSDGSWDLGVLGTAHPGGQTALVLLALLNAGVKPSDQTVQKGLAYLRKIPPRQTYVTGLQTMVFCRAGEKVDHERIRNNVKVLLAGRKADGWTYTLDSGAYCDNSNTQYALLGLHEAIRSGVVKVDDKVLREIRSLFIKTQLRNGGWGYRPLGGDGATMTMTAAGLCNLIITGMDLARGKAVLLPDGSAKDCGEYTDNENVTRALARIGDGFPAELKNDNIVARFKQPFYCLCGIERAGRLTGQRYFGGHDWYEVGCRYLVEAQKGDGSWSGANATFDRSPIVATSFSLLFLSRGRAPVLISKMAYGARDDSGWNNKREDVKHLVDFASRELFNRLPLAWQAFDVRSIDAISDDSRRKLAAELLRSPIVFINGHERAPEDKEADILREYVANGGFILAEACCGRQNFDRSFRKLIRKILPDAELKPLEPEHPVWLASHKFAVSPKEFPLLGVKLGCKTVVIYSPKPITGYWESNNQQKDSRSRKAFELGANIIAYATGLEPPPPRLTRMVIADDGPAENVKPGSPRMGQLRYEGNWKPAPWAMRNLRREARQAGLSVAPAREVDPSFKAVLDYRFLYMAGRGPFTAKKEDLAQMRAYLQKGRLLLADACCGDRRFDASFRTFIKDLFDDKLKLEPIPATDRLFGADLNQRAISSVRRRTMTADGKRVDPALKTLPPALEGVKYKGRWVVIYSKADIGCALAKHSSSDCPGHDSASASRLARAALLYALKP